MAWASTCNPVSFGRSAFQETISSVKAIGATITGERSECSAAACGVNREKFVSSRNAKHGAVGWAEELRVEEQPKVSRERSSRPKTVAMAFWLKTLGFSEIIGLRVLRRRFGRQVWV